ncbi:MAG: T9SS type A sorting domain-containing protein [Flavobacteriaceae bacterium]|nr:T9SS type A sorting domain-containing protein [Flavobacteriaceae bacterium]
MKFYIYLLSFILLPNLGQSQQLNLVIQLESTLKESSGLIYLNNKIITHNDSGNEAALYELDSLSGNTTRKIIINNATNTDWEDITKDDTYIYIGDFGNNNGNRVDLKIYKILISDYLNNNNVNAEIINFSYADQTDFTAATFATNFDAEALISKGNKLYIFTKNWGDKWTSIYEIPKVIGTYSLNKIDQINVEGLITGADYIPNSNQIILSGYSAASIPFIVLLSNFSGNLFSNGTINKYIIQPPTGFSNQIESVTYKSDNYFYLTAEEDPFGKISALYSLSTSNLLGIGKQDLKSNFIYPNPANNVLMINTNQEVEINIYDTKGVLQKTSFDKNINISYLKKGLYLVVIKNLEGKNIASKKLIIN